MKDSLKAYLKSAVADCDAALDTHLPVKELQPSSLHEAMRYTVFAGGKRLRPVLCFAAAEACGGNAAEATHAAVSLELLHTYSLVHDDLPSMDDDDLRRGRPTCHKVYGEGMAVLCGDALLTKSFEILAKSGSTEMITELAIAGGSEQMIGGQVLDLEGEGKSLTEEQLLAIHVNKTGALLRTSVRLGGLSAGASDEQLEALSKYGESLGLAFQIIDDILDVTQTSEQLGKTSGKDEAVDKATYPAILGMERSKSEARRLTDEALAATEIFGEKGQILKDLVEWMLVRNY